jgi:hypothetical protein
MFIRRRFGLSIHPGKIVDIAAVLLQFSVTEFGWRQGGCILNEALAD